MKCGLCGRVTHRDWCRWPAVRRTAKRRRNRANQRRRRVELARLVRAQEADLRRKHRQPAQRFGPDRLTVVLLSAWGDDTTWNF